MRKGQRHAKPDWRGSDGAVELDSADGMGLELGRTVVDRRLAGAGVPGGGDRDHVLGGVRQSPAAVLPGDGARGGRLGYDGLALHDSVSFRSRTLSGGVAHVLVGRSAHGVVLLVRPGALPPGVRRLDLGSAPARRRDVVEDPEKNGHLAISYA